MTSPSPEAVSGTPAGEPEPAEIAPMAVEAPEEAATSGTSAEATTLNGAPPADSAGADGAIAPDGSGEDELLEDGDERGLPDFRRRKKEPRTFEEKLRAYKKQSQERLLDLKRSREAKLGGKKKTRR